MTSSWLLQQERRGPHAKRARETRASKRGSWFETHGHRRSVWNDACTSRRKILKKSECNKYKSCPDKELNVEGPFLVVFRSDKCYQSEQEK